MPRSLKADLVVCHTPPGPPRRSPVTSTLPGSVPDSLHSDGPEPSPTPGPPTLVSSRTFHPPPPVSTLRTSTVSSGLHPHPSCGLESCLEE